MDEFVTIEEAARMLGIHRSNVSRKISRGEISAYTRPANRRQKWLRRSDVEAMAIPQLMPAPPAPKQHEGKVAA